MDFSLTYTQINQRKEYFKVCSELEKQKPVNFVSFESIFEHEDCWQFHRYCAKEYAKRGWLTLAWPTEYGGTGTMMDKVMLGEATGYHGVPGVDGFGVQMLAPTLLATANDNVKKRFLPTIANADVFWCELWSEPNAGSDLAALNTTAIKKGNEYIINGQKTWNSGAHSADWGFGVFKSDLTARKHHNLTFLLFDMKTPGISIRPIPYMTGVPIYNEVYFDDVHVPAENVVGQENGGWAVVNTLAAFERSMMGWIMAMLRSLETLIEYCNTTNKDGRRLSLDPITRNRIAQLACELEAARTLAYRIADLQERSELPLMDASALKVFASELVERFAFTATDILGPYGQVKHSKWSPMDGAWEYLYQACFVFTISMGTNEIQRNIIAWYGLGLPRMK